MATSSNAGYDVEFVEPLPSNLECPVCLLALREPNILSCCGIKVCKSCIGQVKKICPVCREPDFSTMLEKQLCRLVLDLKVYCKYNNLGCGWKGELRDLEKHLQDGDGSCEFVEVACQHGCGKLLVRREAKEHEQQDCPKRPLESQVYQMRQEVMKIKENHANEIGQLREKIDSQDQEIACLKSRIKTLEDTGSKMQTALDNMVTRLPPPSAPPPPPLKVSSLKLFSPPSLPPPPVPPPPPSFIHKLTNAPPPPVPPPPVSSISDITFNLQNGRLLIVRKGDICVQNVDIIVNSSDQCLQHDFGLGLALNEASLGMLQKHSDRLILHSGDLAAGEVVSTAAGGNLKCSNVIHTNLPDQYLTNSVFIATIHKCLSKAESLDARSIAFPSIGTGGRGLKPEYVAKVMLEGVVTYKYSSRKLTNIYFVLYEEVNYKAFVEELKLLRLEKDKNKSSYTEKVLSLFRGSN